MSPFSSLSRRVRHGLVTSRRVTAGNEKAPVDELADKGRFITTTRGFRAFYRASLPLSRQTLNFAAGIIRRHRISIGSLWQKLNPGQQALLVLVYLRKGETFADGASLQVSRYVQG